MQWKTRSDRYKDGDDTAAGGRRQQKGRKGLISVLGGKSSRTKIVRDSITQRHLPSSGGDASEKEHRRTYGTGIEKHPVRVEGRSAMTVGGIVGKVGDGGVRHGRVLAIAVRARTKVPCFTQKDRKNKKV